MGGRNRYWGYQIASTQR